MKALDAMDSIRWMEQAQEEAITWARSAVVPIPSEKRLADFSAGFIKGWRQAVTTLKVQGIITVTDKVWNPGTKEYVTRTPK